MMAGRKRASRSSRPVPDALSARAEDLARKEYGKRADAGAKREARKARAAARKAEAGDGGRAGGA